MGAPKWTYGGTVTDGLRWSQRAVSILGRDLISVLAALDGAGMLAAMGRLQQLADERKAAAKLAAAEGIQTDDQAATLAAMQAVKDVLPGDVAAVLLERIESPEALDLLLDASRLCDVDGERFDPDTASGMTIRQILEGVLSVMTDQAVFR